MDEYVSNYNSPKTIKSRLAEHEPIIDYTIYYDQKTGALGWITCTSPPKAMGVLWRKLRKRSRTIITTKLDHAFVYLGPWDKGPGGAMAAVDQHVRCAVGGAEVGKGYGEGEVLGLGCDGGWPCLGFLETAARFAWIALYVSSECTFSISLRGQNHSRPSAV